MNTNSNSYHHKDKRAHIPSKEEAGDEEANPNVNDRRPRSQPVWGGEYEGIGG